MTCIAASIDNKNGTIFMGGDSAGLAGLKLTHRAEPKVFVKNKFIFGLAGSPRMAQLIRFDFSIPEHPSSLGVLEYMVSRFIRDLRQCLKDGGYAKVDKNVEETTSTCLIGYRGELFTIYSDFQVAQTQEAYYAIGCGDRFALGSFFSTPCMTGRRRVLIALEAAEFNSAGVRRPFVIKQLRYKI